MKITIEDVALLISHALVKAQAKGYAGLTEAQKETLKTLGAVEHGSSYDKHNLRNYSD